jgi:hypothetical protein
VSVAECGPPSHSPVSCAALTSVLASVSSTSPALLHAVGVGVAAATHTTSSIIVKHVPPSLPGFLAALFDIIARAGGPVLVQPPASSLHVCLPLLSAIPNAMVRVPVRVD